MSEWTPDSANWRVVCQRCGKTGVLDNDKPNVSWYLHWYIMKSTDWNDIEVEYHLCGSCEQEVFPDRL